MYVKLSQSLRDPATGRAVITFRTFALVCYLSFTLGNDEFLIN